RSGKGESFRKDLEPKVWQTGGCACRRLDQGPKENHTRPPADPLFRSAASIYGSRVIGIILTGGGSDGTQGLIAIEQAGGLAIVQDPGDARDPSMPMSALLHDNPDLC